MTSTEQLLEDRGSDYGPFKDNALRAQELKKIVYSSGAMFMAEEREAMDMICSKLARISYCPNHIDSWRDITGYATLVVKELEK